ncbi:hypothetical protein QCD71_03595 [Sphingomonas sp. PsM26]|nr:hypothetical protein [Sphingomonas sp. PsM26]
MTTSRIEGKGPVIANIRYTTLSGVSPKADRHSSAIAQGGGSCPSH